MSQKVGELGKRGREVPVRHPRSRNSALCSWPGSGGSIERSSPSGPHVTVRPDPPIARYDRSQSLPSPASQVPTTPAPSTTAPATTTPARQRSRHRGARARHHCPGLRCDPDRRRYRMVHLACRARPGPHRFRPRPQWRGDQPRPSPRRGDHVGGGGRSVPAGAGHHRSRGGQRASGHPAASPTPRRALSRPALSPSPRPRPGSAPRPPQPRLLLLCQSAPLRRSGTAPMRSARTSPQAGTRLRGRRRTRPSGLPLAERQGRLGRVPVDHLEWGHAGPGVGDG